MKLLKAILLFFIIISFTISFSQENIKYEIFLDENNNIIEPELYNKKCKAFMFHCMEAQKDSLLVNFIKEGFKFGKFNKTEYNQIIGLLNNDKQNNNQTSETLIITFRNTLMSYNSYKIHRPYINYTEREFNEKAKKYIKDQKRCIKRSLTQNLKRLYLYNSNIGYTFETSSFKWVQSSSVLNNILFDSENSMVILKPNGTYFYFREIHGDFISELLSLKNWDSIIETFELAKTNPQITYLDVFEKIKKSNSERSKINFKPANSNCYYQGDY